MKKSILLHKIFCGFLFCSLCLLSLKSKATITGGTVNFGQVGSSYGGYACAGTWLPILNAQGPTGGSGQYMYSWEISWKGYPPYDPTNVGDTFPTLTVQVSTNGDIWYYRRKVKDRNNPNDSAYSNEILTAAYYLSAGEIQFSNYSLLEYSAIGTTPPYIRQTVQPQTNDMVSSFELEAKVGLNGSWYSLYPSSQPLPRSTPDTVYYRKWVTINAGCVTDVTNEITLIFYQPIVFNPGIISSDTNNVCSGTPIHLISTATTAPPPLVYEWEYSADSLSWGHAAYTDSFTINNLSATRYYRRSVTANHTTYYSNVIKVSLISPGNPSVFGNQQWNIYGYNGKDLNTTGITYKGYYTTNVLNINTVNNWADSLSPSAAAGYKGCPISNDNFTIAARRLGFDSGFYQLQIPLNNDAVQININGSALYSANCCNINPANLNIGKLGPSTKIEVIQATGTAHSALQVNFIKIDTANTSTYTDSLCNTINVRNPAYNQFVPLVDSTGQIVAAVNPSYVFMGTVTVAMKHSAPGAANMPVGNFGVLNMPRYFNFSASNYINTPFPNPVTVRLYYLNSEFDDYKIATNQPSLTINDLRVAHYDGINQDCSINNNSSAGDTLVPIGSGPFGANAFYIDVLATRFSEFGVNGSLSTLPVKWLSANATARKNEVLLQWRVANEMNNNGFEIQRSNDGFSYTTIGKVASRGNSETAVAYSFTDKTIVENSTIYYRIKQVDKDNRFSLSQVMKVKLDNIHQIVLQSNPVNNTATLRANSIISHISITDVSGRILYNAKHSSNKVLIDVSTFSRGVYVIKALLETGKERVLKMVKE